MRGAIMFSPEMAKALRDGTKTQTRRKAWVPASEEFLEHAYATAPGGSTIERERPSQWQQVVAGELLWVREPFRGAEGYERMNLPPSQWGNKPIWYPADGDPPGDRWGFLSNRVRLARHMPRDFSRTTLRVTATRLERVQAITDADALAEGIRRTPDGWFSGSEGQEAKTPAGAFALLWDRLHGRGAWADNPEIVVIGFDVARMNINQIGNGEPA